MMSNYKSNQKNFTNSICIDDFLLLTVIGKGSYAKVVMVKKIDTNEILALKILKKKKIEKKKKEKYISTERNILIECNHPFIVKLKYSFQNETKLYFALEFCPGGELFNLLYIQKQFNEEQYYIFFFFNEIFFIFI